MIPVVYSEQIVGEVSSFSPSAKKPKILVESWLASNEPICIVEPRKATIDELCEVHDRKYVTEVLACKQPNGFGTKDKSIAESVQYTVGGMLTAIQAAKISPVVCVPVSGFHHARYAGGGGFCTFNGLMAAAVKHGGKVAIVDCDMHYGDGTADCLRHIAPSTIKQASFGAWYDRKDEGDAYLARLNTLWMTGWFDGMDMILYQAGADVWVHDPLGGVLTEDQMRIRDRIMFSNAKKAGIPIVWNFAGGYSDMESIVRIHTTTLKECLEVFGEVNCTENLVAVQ